MKNLLFLLVVSAFFVACSDDDDDTNSPIKGLEIPQSITPIKPGTSITIKGEGFTQTSEIWFRTLTTRAESRKDVKATVTEVNTTGITFIAPEVYGNQIVLLKENGQEYELGKMTFEEMTLLPKRVSKIILSGYEDNITTYEFKYENEGRIDEITETVMDSYSNRQDILVHKYIYTKDKITMSNEEEKETYTLQDRKASSYTHEDIGYEDRANKYDFTYEGNYLSIIKSMIESRFPETETLSFSNGNLIRYTYAEEDRKDCKGSIVFKYGNQKNDLNIDLFAFLSSVYFDTNFGNVWLLGIGGKRSAYLPESAKFTDPQWDDEEEEIIGEEITTDTFKYEVKDGYITKLTTYDEKGKVNWIWEIFYEE